MYKAVVFDLDGTLLNTLHDLSASCNEALKVCGYPARTMEEVRCFVGNGIRKLMERALPSGSTDEQVETALSVFREHYAKHHGDATCPYPGVLSLMRSLQKADIPVCVLSNKNDPNVQALCQRFFPGLYTLAVGEKAGVRPKPCPDGLAWLCRELQVSLQEVCLIGDSEVDVQTAQAANTGFAAVSWGFRTEAQLRAAGAERIFHNTEALCSFLLTK